MKRISLCVAALGLALAANSAYATKPGNNGGGNGGCGQGQQTNGCGTTPTGPVTNTATGGAGGNGYGLGVGIGQGGQGGAGGQGGKGGEGGSVWGSGNSSNVNANTNKQAQGQQQGQGQAQSSRNSNRNTATGGDASNSGNNSAQTVNVGGSTYEASRIPVATAYAPNIAPTATCMGSSSAGGQGMSFGFSVGTSWTDENCMKLERVRTVATVIGDREIAAEMMCDIPDYAAARARAGKPCGGTVQTASAAPAVQPVAEAHQPKYVASAPIVVSPVPPRIERFRITTDGLQRVN